MNFGCHTVTICTQPQCISGLHVRCSPLVFCTWLYCIFPLNQWSSICHAPHPNAGHSWLNAVMMECAWYYLQLSRSFEAFVGWWVFVLQQFPGSSLCAQQKLCSVWDTSENQHDCTNCSQFLTEWTPLSHPTTSRETGICHGPPDRDESVWRKKTACICSGLLILRKKRRGETAGIDLRIWIKYPGHKAILSTKAPDFHSDLKWTDWTPTNTSLSTSESHDHECQQTHWGAFLCAFQCLFNEITGCIICFSQTQLKKKKNSTQSQWYNTREGPNKKPRPTSLFSPRTRLICSFRIKLDISRGEPPTWFSCPIKTGLYQTCAPRLHLNISCNYNSIAASPDLFHVSMFTHYGISQLFPVWSFALLLLFVCILFLSGIWMHSLFLAPALGSPIFHYFINLT